jgi:hypothetical protein
MNFENVDFQTNDGENASRRRWQQVLDFGCAAEAGGRRAVQPTEAPMSPAFEVIP